MLIRTALNEDEVLQAFQIEELSYTPEAAASSDAFLQRFRLFPSYFTVAEAENQLVGVANGVRLSHDDLSDEGMKQMSDFTLDGPYFCLLTVAVNPGFRRKGIGTRLLQAVVRQARTDQLTAVLLMCEEHLVPFYAQTGFFYVRPSASLHGGISWHEMRLELQQY
ncbi:MAG: N-acetyltransferase [Paenibacillus sp.]|jgi:GNAT superfamily N-acetyltransferase|nr:N-acetyltransferase [Paenibacillus sp.]